MSPEIQVSGPALNPSEPEFLGRKVRREQTLHVSTPSPQLPRPTRRCADGTTGLSDVSSVPASQEWHRGGSRFHFKLMNRRLLSLGSAVGFAWGPRVFTGFTAPGTLGLPPEKASLRRPSGDGSRAGSQKFLWARTRVLRGQGGSEGRKQAGRVSVFLSRRRSWGLLDSVFSSLWRQSLLGK